MSGLSSSRSHNSTTDLNASGSSDAPSKEQYDDVSGSLRPSTALSLPEVESFNEIEELETGGPYPARKLPNLNFAPTHEGSLLGSIHTRIAALRSTAADAQARYSQAVNSTIPQDPIINKNTRMTVANALWNSAAFFEEEEAAAQLLRYREMFAYLSQRHAESLASSSLYQAQHLVRRGQISVAAIRLTGSRFQGNVYHSIAQGHHARHSSEVSVWDWKPWREIALAEKISERRRQRVGKERERRREICSQEKRFNSLSNYRDGMNQEPEEECGEDITPGNANTGLQTRRRRKPRMTSTGQMRRFEERIYYSGGESTGEYSTYGDDPTGTLSLNSSRASFNNLGSSTDGATSREKLIPALQIPIPGNLEPPYCNWTVRPKEKIVWRIPVYHDTSSDSITIPPLDRQTGTVQPTIAAVTNAVDMFQRIHTINEPSGMGYASPPPLGLGPGISPQISPKSQAFPNTSSGNDTSTTSTDEMSSAQSPETVATSLSRQSSVSFKKVLLDHRKKPATRFDDSKSDSTIGISTSRDHLRKIKSVLKSFPLKNVFPWSSSSEEGEPASADSSLVPSSSEKSWPSKNSIPPDYGLVPPPTRQKYYPYAEYLDDPAPQTRIHSPQLRTTLKKVTITSPHSPPHPGTKVGHVQNVRHRESDPLTRTEKEYQEVLAALNELKRDMRAGRITKSRSRGKTSEAREERSDRDTRV